MEFSHGLCFGRRQLTILTPQPLSFTSRLCLPSHRLTSLEMCQLALSQIRSRVFLPTLSRPSQHHERTACLWSSRACRRRTLSTCPRAVEGRGRSRIWPWGRGRPWRPTVGSCEGARPPRRRRSKWAAPPGSTSIRPQSLLPTRGGPQPPPSVGRAAFFRSYKGSGEVIHRLARCQRIPRKRQSVARMVSPETLFSVRPSSKAASAAISRVHRLLSYPNSLGERWSIPRSRSAEFASKAACTRFGVEEPAMSASKPFSLKARMALRTVCEAHPRLSAILGGELPRALASSIWQRRITKVSLERSPTLRLSRSFSDKFRTNIGGFMKGTIAHHTQPSLKMH